MKNRIEFTGKNGEFRITHLKQQHELNFPVANEEGIKSSVTQNFGGDCKLDQNHFLLEPVSIENLHNNRSTRNIWCTVDREQSYSLTGASAQCEYKRFIGKEENAELDAGFMWQEVKRTIGEAELEATVRIFAPLGFTAEVMQVKVTNKSNHARKITVTPAIPLYGRSADNLRDHRHVTSLLHRIETMENGICCKPVLSFDERGHQRNDMIYYVLGSDENGDKPEGFFPTVESFIGESGSFIAPEAVAYKKKGCKAGTSFDGKEAVGAFAFPEVTLESGAQKEYIVVSGMAESRNEVTRTAEAFHTKAQTDEAFAKTKTYWNQLVNISFETGDPKEDNYLKWICFQPILRRIYGCSFLPYHDYVRGGRGWRDLWQDCLSLLILDPKEVRSMILNSFEGVRFDGTNATIIGNKPGEFVADRNNITRVWMDHAFWPFVTTKLYMNQTGDLGILKEEIPYFKDPQVCRGRKKDTEWNADYGMRQKTTEGSIYKGTVLEHLLLQNLCAFYEAGEHGAMLLRGADWNDALDMADERGESVAFTCAYIGNLRDLADALEAYKNRCHKNDILIAKEIGILIAQKPEVYRSTEKRNAVLNEYAASCVHNITGEKIRVDIDVLVKDLRDKADWYSTFIRENEWVEDGEGRGWFNGYYDNSGRRVEGVVDGNVRMMLTGQVFSIMGNVADDAQVSAITESADAYLYKKEIGGYRLNTDFKEEKFDLGRMFGFAYGEKENGAVFSHMTVMYANALYQRGFVKEGYKALYTLLSQAMDTKVSRMYPGLPEYFDAEGKGKYPYLTGAASWYMMTVVTQIYGFHGLWGDLMLEPKILLEQFDTEGNFSAEIPYRGQTFSVVYQNPDHREYGDYHIDELWVDGELYRKMHGKNVCIPFSELEGKDAHTLRIVLK